MNENIKIFAGVLAFVVGTIVAIFSIVVLSGGMDDELRIDWPPSNAWKVLCDEKGNFSYTNQYGWIFTCDTNPRTKSEAAREMYLMRSTIARYEREENTRWSQKERAQLELKAIYHECKEPK